MPEGEPLQFDPQEPIDEPIAESIPESVEQTAEAEPSLEDLKNPEYWEQEFQKSWEAKAGQEKNSSGMKVLSKFIPDGMDSVVAIQPNGGIICNKESYPSTDFYLTQFQDSRGTRQKVRRINLRRAGEPLVEVITRLRNYCRSSVKLSDGVRVVIVHAGQTETYLRVDDPQERGRHHNIPDPIEYQDEWNKYGSLTILTNDLILMSQVDLQESQKMIVMSSPFYAGYWSEMGSISNLSLGGILTKTLDDITNMPLERIQGIQIQSAMKIFLEKYSNPKNPKFFCKYTEAFRTGFESWRYREVEKQNQLKKLPRPAGKPEISTETLPRTADRHDLDQ